MTRLFAPAPDTIPRPRSGAIAAAKSLRDLLKQREIAPRRRFGQNFLHETRVARRIAEAVEAAPGEHVVEIGPGLGALTVPLLDAGVCVTAVEIDRRLADYLEAELGSRAGFTLVRGDALTADLERLAPDARALVANLPYSITGPVLARLTEPPARLERAVLMLQKEVGARLVAGAGGRGLGAIAVLLRQLWRVERLFEVGKGAFLPAPEVVSVVLRFTRIPGADVPPALRDAVNRAYRQRRKMLRKTLADPAAPEAAWAEALVAAGLPDTARPEDVDPAIWPGLLRRAHGGPA